MIPGVFEIVYEIFTFVGHFPRLVFIRIIQCNAITDLCERMQIFLRFPESSSIYHKSALMEHRYLNLCG